MSPRPRGRTEACGPTEARKRQQQADRFLEVAKLTAEDLAVLAGIAASDAACCAALAARSRGQDHKQATELLAQIVPGGADAAKRLARLLDLKDTAQYGVIHPSPDDLVSSLRNAERLVAFARQVLAR